jgi:hypothetical protein
VAAVAGGFPAVADGELVLRAVERTLAWLTAHRRLACGCERHTTTRETTAFVVIESV